MSTRDYKDHKWLKKENLRDNTLWAKRGSTLGVCQILNSSWICLQKHQLQRSSRQNNLRH
jgi:hypothetical protein